MRPALLLLLFVTTATNGYVQEVSTNPKSATPDHSDVPYSSVADSQKLDLYLPDQSAHPSPCIIFVHGGGWKNGSKKSGAKNAAWLANHGFAVASIDYRLTDTAQWPAQIDDCHAAVDWVRRNAAKYNIAPERIGVFGTSAGGHLVALMGTRPSNSRVQAVCDWFGPSELLTMPPNNVGDVANSNGAKLLGATVREVPKLAKDASALDHVSADDAAFLIMHGEKDPGVPLEQSQKLHAKLIGHGVPSKLHVVAGAGHGGKEFHTQSNRQIVLRFFQRTLMSNWSQASGANGSFAVADANAPASWSVVRNENVRWRKSLPETGQSTVVTWGDRIFFTTLQPVHSDSELGSNIVAWCCNAETGETIWKKDIPAEHPLRLSGCFSDSSSPPPVTDGQRVVFFNASGRIVCFDFDGKQLWQNEMMPVGRSQPFRVGDNLVFISQSYMPDEHGHFTHEHKNLPVEEWTQLQALNIATGKPAWKTECGSNMGCVPLPLTRTDGREVIVVGRGGGHSPPEKPEGISMVSAQDGSTLWTLPLKKFMSTMTFNLYGDEILVFHGGEHLWVDATTGKITRRASIVGDVTVDQYSKEKDVWRRNTVKLAESKKFRMIIQQSNVLAGRYHYFRSYTQPWLGRVDVVSGSVEYLQLPIQLKRDADDSTDHLFWDISDMSPQAIEVAKNSQNKSKPLKSVPIQFQGFALNDMKNSSGHRVVGDLRSRGNGWGHHASQLPTVIGKRLFVPTMSGTVYVIDYANKVLDNRAIVSINDLGPVGESWNRASLSFSRGRLYAHTIRELICIE